MLQRIKDSIPIKECMERYGVKFNSHEKCCCPFHKEKTPSLSLKEDKFKCFGCGAGGDIFDFMMMYFHIGLYDAQKKLDNDFGLGLLDTELTPHQKRIMREEMRRRKSAQLIEKAERGRKQKDYLDKCDKYREAANYIKNYKPIGEHPSLEWIQAFNTVQYLEYWFEEAQCEGI